MKRMPLVVVALAYAAWAFGGEDVSMRRYEWAGGAIEAGFAPVKAEIAAGEPAFVDFRVRNVGDKSFEIHSLAERAKRSTRFSITAVNAAGAKVKDPLTDNPSWGGIGRWKRVAPGEEATYRLFLPQWLDLSTAGTYTVSCRGTVDLAPSVEGHPGALLAGGRPETVDVASEFRLTVVPRDPARAAEIIERFGAQVSSDDPLAFREAVAALSVIPDERVVPCLSAALARRPVPMFEPGGMWWGPYIDRSYPYAAIEALGRLRNAEARETLLAILSSGDRDVTERAAAAEALGVMKSSSALPALESALAFGGSDLAGFELPRAAAQALAAVGDPSAVPSLEAQLANPDMRVRFAVVEALYALGGSFGTDWIIPVIKSKDRTVFENAEWFVLRHAGWEAPRTLAECLDMDDASGDYYNYSLVWKIAASGGPRLVYNTDLNGKVTDAQLAENRRTLDALHAWLEENRTRQAQ